MKSPILFIILAICISFSCKKSKLTGDYIVCKINGVDWKAQSDKSFYSFAPVRTAKLHLDGKIFTLYGSQNSDVSEMNLDIYDTVNAIHDGMYELRMGSYHKFNSNNNSKYITDSTHSGYLVITIKENGKRVTGGFSFTARLEGSNDVITVTDGSFNLPL